MARGNMGPDANSQPDITALLARVARNDDEALSELFQVVYEEVRAQASRTLRRLPKSGTMNTTAAVHESFLRLFGDSTADLKSRRQFYFATARAIRDVLIEHLRSRGAQKRGGGKMHIDLDAIEPTQDHREEVVLMVHDALDTLRLEDTTCADVVQLRFFGGLTHEEISESLDISVARARREWAYAKDWLARRLAD